MAPNRCGRVVGRCVVAGIVAAFSLQTVGLGMERQIDFDRLTTNDGLAQNTATSILQDSRGFLWIGTEGGLNRYDGYTFKVFKPDPEVPGTLGSNQVWALFEDSAGVLWVGTYAGLDRFDRITETFVHHRHDPADSKSLSDNSVRTIFEDHQGSLWVGTKRGLNRVVADRSLSESNTTASFERFLHDPADANSLGNDHVRSILEDRSGRLWVATVGGLDLLDRNTGWFTHYLRTAQDPEIPGGDGVLDVFEASDGQLWLGTFNGGLDMFDPTTGTFENVALAADGLAGSDSILTVTQDRHGRLWIGTYGGGLVVLDPRDGSSLRFRAEPSDPRALSDDLVWSVFEDRTGIIWVGTSRGIAKFDPTRRKFDQFRAVEEAADLNYVRAVAQDRSGDIWVGARGGLMVVDRTRGVLELFRSPVGRSIRSHVRVIVEDSQRVLWIGTNAGVYLMGSDRREVLRLRLEAGGRTTLDDDLVTSIVEDRNQVMWIGTRGGGLHRVVLGSSDGSEPRPVARIDTFRRSSSDGCSIADDHVRTLFEDGDGRLWVGTHGGGLDLFDDDRECFVHHPADPGNPSGLSSAAVTCVFQDHQGRLWVATYGGGICRFQPSTGEFERFTEKNGLADNVVYGVLEDGLGRLWLSTNHGLSRFDPADEAAVRFRNFGVSDGLQGTEFNTGAYHLGSDGEMFFGGVNGLNGFRPETITENPYPPAVVLTELELFNRPIAPGELLNGRRIIDCSIVECEVLSLKYDENVFALRFSGLHFADPRANTYAFMLDGFEERWNRVGERRYATYTRVPPGRYLFRVRAANPDGLWSDNDAVLAIHIEPPFWMTWWFRSIVGLCFAGAVVAAYRLRTARLRERTRALEQLNVRLEQQVSERLRAEAEKDRLLGRVQGMHEALERAYDATLEGWARALELRDHDTEGHTRRVTELTVELARRMGFDDDLVEQLRRGAILHDIGKMAIPDSLLGKSEPLTDEDWTILRKHPDYARRLLDPIGFLRPAMDIPYAHHERWDGSGYPRGLAGLEIPLAARIFAVVDVWDALRSNRPYRSGWSEERVRRHLAEGAGTLFDPLVVREFLALLEERNAEQPDAPTR